MNKYVCVKGCGHEVISAAVPSITKWSDGHVCVFVEESWFAGEKTDANQPVALFAIKTIIDHAQEQCPHFESVRGQKNISEAIGAVEKLSTLLEAAQIIIADLQIVEYQDPDLVLTGAIKRLRAAIAQVEGNSGVT
jgi:hypothetical protein